MNNSPVSLVVGADGLLGKALVDHLRQAGEPVIGTTRRSHPDPKHPLLLDLSQDLTEWVPPCPVSVAYLCAAVASIHQCHQHPTETANINVWGTVTLAQTLIQQGALVIFLSSNAVYDGSLPFRQAEDPTCPQTEYGRQKATAEEKLLALGEQVAIVRLTKVFGPQSRLLKGWATALREEKLIHPLADLVTAPIAVSQVAQILHQLGQSHQAGIWQLSGQVDVSYAELAYQLANQLQADSSLVQPKTAEEAGIELESVPQYTTLDTTRLQEALGIAPPDIQTTLGILLQQGL